MKFEISRASRLTYSKKKPIDCPGMFCVHHKNDNGLSWREWFIEVDSLDALEDLGKSAGHELIIEFGEHPTITIYDDCVE